MGGYQAASRSSWFVRDLFLGRESVDSRADLLSSSIVRSLQLGSTSPVSSRSARLSPFSLPSRRTQQLTSLLLPLSFLSHSPKRRISSKSLDHTSLPSPVSRSSITLLNVRIASSSVFLSFPRGSLSPHAHTLFAVVRFNQTDSPPPTQPPPPPSSSTQPSSSPEPTFLHQPPCLFTPVR